MVYQRIFGPVPSRRLGKSLGINNVPPKNCTYACIYCQLGNMTGMSWERDDYYDPVELAREAEAKIRKLERLGEKPDFLTIVPDGEPTLDRNLGRLIKLLKPLGVNIAVISNASTIHLPEVREELASADWVSLKVDSLLEQIWKKVNRPHGKIVLENIRDGLIKFSNEFRATLVSETMLVRDINDSLENISDIASILSVIRLTKAYLAVPTRPPAESWVLPPIEENLNRAYHIFKNQGLNTELLIGYEGNEFSSTGDLETDLLSISAVHPLREDAVTSLLERTGSTYSSLEKLINSGKLMVSEYEGQRYYSRKFTKS
jgi:wyosine [tRNA(Phe)-imidazoG37] synthetase (radical SAM superfamily)